MTETKQKYGPSLLLIALLSMPTHADFTGRVVSVHDGDTIGIMRDGVEVKVRLVEIDAPELSQPYGQASKRALSAMIYGRAVAVKEHGRDKYARTLGRVVVGGTDANLEQIRAGMAWAFRKYLTDSSLLQVEAAARDARLGLWADNNPAPPWDFRHSERSLPVAAATTPQNGQPRLSTAPKGELDPSRESAAACGSKTRCPQMTSCVEARHYLNDCGVDSLDRDHDGVPCESLCNGK